METKRLYNFGPFQIDTAKRVLQRDQETIPLSAKAFEALVFLVHNCDRLVEKNELMNALWPNTSVEENNLSQSISAIRKALGDSPQEQHYIKTVRGWGYRFAAPVIVGKVPLLVDDESLNENPAVPLVSRQSARKGPLADRMFWVGLVLASALAAVAGLSMGVRRGVHQNKPLTTSQPPRKSVAVMGFDNLSADKKEAWLSTAFAEMLSTELSAGGALRLIPGEEVARVRTELPAREAESFTGQRVQELEQKLGSDLSIFGSYVVIGEKGRRQIRLDVRLENAKSKEMIDQIAETGDADDLFDLVSQAGIRLRKKLKLSDLSPTEAVMLRAGLPGNSKAVQFYADGIARLRVFDATGARELLLKAVAADQDYPLAHAALADAWSALGYDSKAAEEASTAYRLSKNLSPEDQLSVEGRYRSATREWSKATEVYRSLVALSPDDLDYQLRLAGAQISDAKARDALATLDRVRPLPTPVGKDPRIDLEAAKAWHALGDYKQMEDTLGNASQEAQRNGDRLLLARARSQQCFAWRFLGEQEKAIGACREAQRIYSEAGDRGAEADTLRLLGDVISEKDVVGAMRLYQQALEMQRTIGHLAGEASVLNQMAIQYSDSGDHVASKRFFEQALAIFQRLEDRVTSTGMMINIGTELISQGRPEEARRVYQNTVSAAAALGNRDIQGLAMYDLALIDQVRGDLDKAALEFQQTKELFEAVQDKAQLSTAISGLGQVAMSRADYKSAQQFFESALAIRKSTQQEVPIAESQLDLASLCWERGDPPGAMESSARESLEVFHRDKSVNDEATARGLLARILLKQGKEVDAQAEAERALLVSAKADANIRLSVATTTAPVIAVADAASYRRAVATLKKTIAATRKLRFVAIELEARLALGEIELKSAGSDHNRAYLQALREDAIRQGFVSVAARAAAAGEAPTIHSAPVMVSNNQ